MRIAHSVHGYHARMVEWDADPVLLRTFVAIRRHGNLTRAADELFVSQPAVSRRLERLERSLGLPLFERLGRSLHTTEAGESLAKEADVLLGSLARLAEAVRARHAGEVGCLRIGASTTPGLYLLPEVLDRFRARSPEVDVRFSVENSLQIEERIVRNELDVGFVGAHLAHAALRLDALIDDEIVWYVGARHAWAKARRPVGPRELASQTAIVREPGSATRRLVDGSLRRARVRLGRTIQIACPEAAKVLVRAGLGVSYASASALAGEGGAGLRRIAVAGVDIRRPVFLALHRDKRMSPPMTAFLDLVRARVRAGASAPSVR
jgi:DNA-binding transcriptional LysR family regulator